VARNLALASLQAEGADTLTAPCAACYLNLAKTDQQMREDPRLAATVNEALAAGGLSYRPGSLKVAPYYGCQVVRPDPDARWDDPEHPTALDRLLRALGAEVVDYPLKTACCGGHMTVIGPEVAYGLIRRLVQGAATAGAHVITALCPMCQLNLDAYQVEMNRHFRADYQVPVLYFTQLIGLAFGIAPAALGVGKEFVDAAPALAHIQDEAPEAAKQRRGRRHRAEDGLPMPRMQATEP